jgi:hypothetical protein
MDGLKISFREAAFRHSISKEDICHAIKTARYEQAEDEHRNNFLVLGFDSKATPLEIVYEAIGEDEMCVFHAMKCRTIYLPLLGL